jgi:hypothetical protein
MFHQSNDGDRIGWAVSKTDNTTGGTMSAAPE